MHRKTIHFAVPPSVVRLRARTAPEAAKPTQAGEHEPGPAANPVPPPAAPSAELATLWDNLSSALAGLEQRRRQSLEELQQVAVELAIAAASQLVFESLEQGSFAVEQLVGRAIEEIGLRDPITIDLHPADLQLLEKRKQESPPDWDPQQVVLRPDPSVARGGCRAASAEGRMLVSDISSRLSEIRRHWMEELDDAQTERRSPDAGRQSLRRFPDRRETA